MKILNNNLFYKYRYLPVRIKLMGLYFIAIAEGFPIASFETMKILRMYFPNGVYKKLI
jgi:hypothetical protein